MLLHLPSYFNHHTENDDGICIILPKMFEKAQSGGYSKAPFIPIFTWRDLIQVNNTDGMAGGKDIVCIMRQRTTDQQVTTVCRLPCSVFNSFFANKDGGRIKRAYT